MDFVHVELEECIINKCIELNDEYQCRHKLDEYQTGWYNSELETLDDIIKILFNGMSTLEFAIKYNKEVGFDKDIKFEFKYIEIWE